MTRQTTKQDAFDAMREALEAVAREWERTECPLAQLGPQAPQWTSGPRMTTRGRNYRLSLCRSEPRAPREYTRAWSLNNGPRT